METINPQTNDWGILGHEWAVQLLREHIRRGSLRHSYLFSGPQGIGRRTLALRFTQALNCLQPPAPGEPCRACRICKQIERMQHPDLAVVQAERMGETLRVEQIRDLLHSLALTHYEARYRVALLLRFEEAHPSAANALLKTLEEPPPRVVLIVTAESVESVLPTIVSRCEVLRLRPLPCEVVSAGLQSGWGLAAEQAALLAHLSGGRPGYALRLHQQPDILAQRQTWLDDHRRLLEANRVERFAYADKLTKVKERADKGQMRENLRALLETWLSLWRDVLLSAADSNEPLANLDCRVEIETLAARVGLDNACRVVDALQRTFDLLDRNVNAQLMMEVLLLDLPHG